MEKLYTVKEAAKVIGVSTNTLYKYLAESRIKAVRGTAIQGRFRIPTSALEEFLGVPLSTPIAAATLPSATKITLEEDLTLRSSFPLKIVRLFLVISLVMMLVDIFITTQVTPTTQAIRVLFLAIMLILAYQEGGFRKNTQKI